MDAHEKIVEEWVRLCRGQFTMTNIRYGVPRNYGDIDILAIDRHGKLYDYEVKWRTRGWSARTPRETFVGLARQLLREERIEKIREIARKAPDVRVLVITKIMIEGNRKQREKLLTEFRNHKIDIIYFEDVLAQLIRVVDPTRGRYDSETPELIRMLKLSGYQLQSG